MCDETVEAGAQVMHVLDTLRYVVAIGRVARCGPCKTVLDEISADWGIADRELKAAAAKAVRIEHELTVPVRGYFDSITRPALHSPQARRRCAGEGIKRQLRLIDKVLRRLIGLHRWSAGNEE
jgi:hypothetical protein